MTYLFAIVATIVHLYIFVLESLLWGRPSTNKIFGLKPEVAEINRLFAFNQGFYNLFLAAGAAVGVFFSMANAQVIGDTLMLYACVCMVGAALTLVFSKKRLWRAAVLQGGAPALAIVSYFFF